MTKPPKRPRDPNQLAKMIVDIATGQDVSEPVVTEGLRQSKVKGGKRRAVALTPSERSNIAKKAATKRWEAK